MDFLKKHFILFSISLPLLTTLSCVNFQESWGSFEKKSSSNNINLLLDEAAKIEETASSPESVLLLIDAFKKIEEIDPHHYYALWKIGNYNILMGAAYSKTIKTKKKYYKEAIKYCERAMSVNKPFMADLDKTKDIAVALNKLSINEVDAMGYWYTARFYYFKECLKPLGRIMNTKIVIENNTMIERIDELDPNWSGGANYFSRALYYIAVPEKFGGSKELAADEFKKAIEIGPNYLFNRWGRAKYLYDLTGNIQGFKSDLEWVIAQDPNNGGKTFPWNYYIQEDSKKMLSNIKE